MVEGYHVFEWNNLEDSIKSSAVELALMGDAICEREKVRRRLAFDIDRGSAAAIDKR